MTFNNEFRARLEIVTAQESAVKEYAHLVDVGFDRILQQGMKRISLSSGRPPGYENLIGLLREMQQPIGRIEKQLQGVQSGFDSGERIRILTWISPIPYLQHHSQVKDGVLAGTGTWFLANQKLLDWQKSSLSSILWLHGIPGSGKTNLM